MLTHVAEIEDLYEGWMDAGKRKKRENARKNMCLITNQHTEWAL